MYYRDDEEFTQDFFPETDSVHLAYSEETKQIILSAKNVEPLVMDLKAMLDSLPRSDESDVAQSLLSLEADNRQWKAKIIFKELTLKKYKDSRKIESATAELILRINIREENEVGEKGAH